MKSILLYLFTLFLCPILSAQPVLLPWSEGFESTSFYELDYYRPVVTGIPYLTFEPEPNKGTRVRFAAWGGYTHSGIRSASLDRKPSFSNQGYNHMTFTMDLSRYIQSDLQLSFWWISHGGAGDSLDVVQVREGPTSPWVTLFDIGNQLNTSNQQWWNFTGNLSLSDSLIKAGQSITSSVEIRFSEQGNSTLSNNNCCDGITYDDLHLEEFFDNDASLEDISSFCPGVTPVYVTLLNRGRDTLQSAEVTVKRNNVTYPKIVLSNLNLPKDSSIQVLIGTWNFPNSQVQNFELEVQQVNGKVDQAPGNNLLIVQKSPKFSGAYTIGPQGDFKLIQDAFDALELNGVCGPTTFYLADTLHPGGGTVEDIEGLSAVNTLRFTADPSSQNLPKIEFALAFLSIPYVRIDHLDFATNAACLYVKKPIQNITIDSCLFRTPRDANPYTPAQVSVIGQGNINGFAFHHNELRGGKIGLSLEGDTAMSTQNITIAHNTFIDAYLYGLLIDQINEAFISQNRFENQNFSTNVSLYALDCKKLSIERNFFLAKAGTGIWVQQANSPYNSLSTDSLTIANNMIALVDSASAASSIGIRIQSSHHCKVIGNTLSSRSNVTSAMLLNTISLSNSHVMNNIFSNSSGGNTWHHTGSQTQLIHSHNVYWTGNSGQSGTQNIAPGIGSLLVDPLLYSVYTGDLRANNAQLDGTGTSANNPEDYFGNVRSSTPDIGAHEFTPCDFDASLRQVLNTYEFIPESQEIEWYIRTGNNGNRALTGATLNLNVFGSNYSQSMGSLAVGAEKLTTLRTPITAGPGTYTVNAHLSVQQNDCISANDSAKLTVTITDSAYARSSLDSIDIKVSGSPAHPWIIGQVYELYKSDTLSSVSVYLNHPDTGVQFRAIIYSLNSSTGYPAARLDSSSISSLYNSQESKSGWYHLRIGCQGDRVFAPGKYFIAIEQVQPKSLNIGQIHARRNLKPQIFLDYYKGAGWTRSDDPSILALNDATLLIQPNLGNRWKEPDLLADTTYICQGQNVKMQTNGVYDSYIWSNGYKFPSFKTKQIGQFSVRVWDDIGCEFRDTTHTRQADPILITHLVTHASCGQNDGQIQVQAWGRDSTHTYLWSNGDQGAVLKNIPGDRYQVTATGVPSRCTETKTITVAGGLPEADSDIIRPTCKGDSNARATVHVTKGIEPYTFQWNAGITPNDSTNFGLKAGMYLVTITDSSKCPAVDTVWIADPPEFKIRMTSGNTSGCLYQDGFAYAKLSGGYKPYNYFWGDPNSQSTEKAIGLEQGTYDVTVTDSAGCLLTGRVRIEDPNSPQVIPNDVHLQCSYDTASATVNVSGGIPPYNYRWKWQNDSNQALHGLTPGRYQLFLYDAMGCNQDTFVNITSPPAVNASFSNPVPNGNNYRSVTATVSGGTPPYTSLQWSNGDTGLTNDELTNGAHTFTVVDDNGCSYSFPVYITDIVNHVEGFEQGMEGFRVYPNPNDGRFILASENTSGKYFTVLITNSLGQVVKQKVGLDLTFPIEWRLDGDPGFYLLTIINEEGNQRTLRLMLR